MKYNGKEYLELEFYKNKFKIPCSENTTFGQRIPKSECIADGLPKYYYEKSSFLCLVEHSYQDMDSNEHIMVILFDTIWGASEDFKYCLKLLYDDRMFCRIQNRRPFNACLFAFVDLVQHAPRVWNSKLGEPLLYLDYELAFTDDYVMTEKP